MLDNLFGDDFKINIKQPNTKGLIKKLTVMPETEEDIQKALKSKSLSLADRLAIITENVYKVLCKQKKNVLVIKDRTTLDEYIDNAIASGRIAVDTETNNSLDPVTCQLMGPCFYYPGGKQAYVPINHRDPMTKERLAWQLTEKDITEALQKVIDAKSFVVMHNGKFDYQVLKCTCGVEMPINWDTMIAAHLIDENELAGLKYQYTTKIDKTQSKYDIEKLFEKVPYADVDPEVFALYAATDSFMTDKLYLHQKEIFERPENDKIYNFLFKQIEMPLIQVTAEMELTGVCIDFNVFDKLKIKYANLLHGVDLEITAALQELEKTIKEWRLTKEANAYPKIYQPKKSKKAEAQLEKEFPYVDESTGSRYKISKNSLAEQLGDPINLASPTQLAILFYDVLNCKPVSKKKPRGTGKDEMKALAEKTKLPLCQLILKRRGIEKLITTYIDTIPALALHWPDHRLRAHFKQTGTSTGRYSSGGDIKFLDDSDKQVTLAGANLQNIPSHSKDIRLGFCAATNYEDLLVSEEGFFEIPEYSELETNNGWKYPRDLDIKTDKLICDKEQCSILSKDFIEATKTYRINI